MKKVLSIILILVAAYFIVCDGMSEIFNLAKVWQYMFNITAILGIIPLCVFNLFPVEEDRV